LLAISFLVVDLCGLERLTDEFGVGKPGCDPARGLLLEGVEDVDGPGEPNRTE
jgi:hypothetical protein